MPAETDFDVVVIGSGVGGLIAAHLLARYGRRRVLLLEQHYVLGGATHSFKRKGFEWDVGLHYVGAMGPGTPFRKLFDLMCGGNLGWNKIPSPFERLIYPGIALGVPNELTRWKRRLIHAFPHEEKSIHRYFRDARRVTRWGLLSFVVSVLPVPLRLIPEAWLLLTRRRATQSTGSYMRHRFTDPKLRALVSSQWIDYGVPPAESNFLMHALIVSHYAQGAYYPDEGSGRIASFAEHELEQLGVRILRNTTVVAITTRNRRVGGVEAVTKPSGHRLFFSAREVVSTVGAHTTFAELLPSGVGHREKQSLKGFPRGYGGVILFVGLTASPARLGVHGENLWINDDFDHDDLARQTRSLLDGFPLRCFVSFGSMRAGIDHDHTLQAIVPVDPSLFSAWAETNWNERPAEYERAKREISAGILALLERHLPGVGALVAYHELATPLTVTHFLNNPLGRLYALPETPLKIRQRRRGPRTSVKGLTLGGADAATLGIVSALVGGTLAAIHVGGAALIRRMIRSSSRQSGAPRRGSPAPVPAATVTTAPGRGAALFENEKQYARVLSKEALTGSVLGITLELERAVAWEPGHYARVHVDGVNWRDYSIVSLEGRLLTVWVDTRFAGPGSLWAQQSRVGSVVGVVVPVGSFCLVESERPIVMVATGTGLAPFVPMLQRLAARPSREVTLVFGCRARADDLTAYLPDNSGPDRSRTIVCVSREKPDEGARSRFASAGTVRYRAGRVTHLLASGELALVGADVYAAGNPDMVAEVRALVVPVRGTQLHTEAY